MPLKRDITIRRQKPASSEHNHPGTLNVVSGRRKRLHKFLRAFIRLAIVAALIVGGAYIWHNWDSISPESAIYWLNDRLAGGQSGGGFPVDIVGSSVKSMAGTKDGLALLTDTSLLLYNSNGGQIFQRQHGFFNPILRSAGKWFLIYDAGGNRLRIETRASTLLDTTVDNHIISATMSDNGIYALATDSSEGYTSEIVAYNRHREIIFHWLSTDLTFLDIALSPDGKSLAAIGITALDGAMKSSFLIFDFDNKKPVAEYHSTDTMLFAAGYFPGGTVAAVGETEIWVCNKKGTIQQKHSYDDRELIGYSIGENAVSSVVRDFGSSEVGTVITVNPSGDLAYTAPFEGSFRDIAPQNSGIILLTSKNLLFLDSAGLISTYQVKRDGRMACSLGNKAIVLSLTSLDEYNLKKK